MAKNISMSALQGLNSAMPMDEMMDMSDMSGNTTSDAVSLLQKARGLHKAHMDGSVPTSDESQQQLMDLLEDALEALGTGM